MTTLAEMTAGSTGRVESVDHRSSVARRLMEMGIVPGVDVRVIKAAPFGDPIEVRLLGYNLALRRNEAAAISMRLI